jgi:hypothetical protein
VNFRLLALLACLVAQPAFAFARDPCPPMAGPTSPIASFSTEIVRVNVKGTRFAIPRNYFRHPPKPCGENEGFLLRVLLPEMEPATPENEPRLYGSDVTGSWGQRVQILYETRPRDDLDRAFRIFAPGIDPAAPSLSWKGLAQGQIQRALGPTDIFFSGRTEASYSSCAARRRPGP